MDETEIDDGFDADEEEDGDNDDEEEEDDEEEDLEDEQEVVTEPTNPRGQRVVLTTSMVDQWKEQLQGDK